MRSIKTLCFLILIQFFPMEGSGQKLSGEIKIGLLVQDANSLDAIQGAELAIKMANERKGTKEHKFTLLIRSMQGPWGTGSKEAVDMIFNEKVYGLIGSHDGRNAHLVEQVCAKSHVNFISARTSDPTLSQAFVPWFFNCVPNDSQQSALFIREIYHQEKFQRVAIVSVSDYDSNSFVRNFLKKIKAEGLNEPVQYSVNNEKELQNLMSRIQKENPQCIVLSGQPSFSKEFLQLMKIKKMNQPVFATLFSIDEKLASLHNGNLFWLSSAYTMRHDDKKFREDFEKYMGEKPTEVAAYSFDATDILISAIRNAGYDRNKIQGEITKTDHQGVTGNIRFDDKGNRIDNTALIKIVEGKPTIINK